MAESEAAAPAAPAAKSAQAESPFKRHSNLIIGGVLLLVAVLFPFTQDPLGTLLNNCILALAYVVMALGLNIVVGFAGLLDLGYVAFYALGAYSMGWLASDFYSTVNGGKGIFVLVGETAKLSGAGIHLNFLLILIVATALCALFGMLIGLPTLRLRGDYIAIVTLAFGEIIYRFAANGDSITFGSDAVKLTNGRQAISPVDPIKLPGLSRIRLGLQSAPVLLARARHGRADAVHQLPRARLAARTGPGSPCARTRWQRRRWACRSSRRS